MLDKTETLPLHIRVLQRELSRRKLKNSRYSLRAFAAALRWHPSALSRILSGKQELSISCCTDALKTLRLAREDARLFLASVAQDKCHRAAILLESALVHEYGVLNDIANLPSLADFAKGRNSLDSMLAVASDFISVTNLDWQFLHASESLATIVHRIPYELIGLTWGETDFDPELVYILEQQQLEAQKSNKELNFRFSTGDGQKKKFFRRLIMPISDRLGNRKSYVSYIRDITWETFTLLALEQIHSSIDMNETFSRITYAGIPMLGDACVLQVYDSAGQLSVVSAAHNDERKCDILQASLTDLRAVFQLELEELIAKNLEFEISSVKRTMGEFKISQIINIRLENQGKALGFLSYLSTPERVLTEDETHAISKIRLAASQAIQNSLAAG